MFFISKRLFEISGNKTDCKASERVIRKEDGEKLAKEYNVAFMETSAKTGLNVDLAFTAIARYDIIAIQTLIQGKCHKSLNNFLFAILNS